MVKQVQVFSDRIEFLVEKIELYLTGKNPEDLEDSEKQEIQEIKEKIDFYIKQAEKIIKKEMRNGKHYEKRFEHFIVYFNEVKEKYGLEESQAE